MAVILAAGCAKSESDGAGTLSLRVETQSDVLEITKGDVEDYATLPEIKDFHLKITNWASEVAWEGVYKDWVNGLKLAAGDYSAVIWYGNSEEEGDSKPYFYGEEAFTITAMETKPVTLKPALGNCIVKLEVGSLLDTYFKSGKFSITTGAKNTFSLYDGDYVFIDAYKFTLKCELTTKTGEKKSFSKDFDNLSPATCYSLKVELSNVDGLSFTVTFNDTVETITIEEELNK